MKATILSVHVGTVLAAATLLTGCGEDSSSSGAPTTGATAGSQQGVSQQPEAIAPVELLSMGLDIAEISRSDIGRARVATRRSGMVVMAEEAILWQVNIISQSEKEITSLRVKVSYHTRNETVEAIPSGSTLGPSGLLDVVLALPLPYGRMPPSLNVEGTVVGVRFADGSTLGDIPEPATPSSTGATPPGPTAEPKVVQPEIAPAALSWEPYDGELISHAEISFVEATYGTADNRVDVSREVESWMGMVGLWPIPLQVTPDRLGVSDPAPGEVKTLRIVMRVGEQEVTVSESDGDHVFFGGPGSVESGVLATNAPIEIDGFRIITAWYGSGDDWVNGMPGLESEARGGTIETSVTSQVISFDPTPGVKKELRIYAEVPGMPGVHRAVVDEGALLRLP